MKAALSKHPEGRRVWDGETGELLEGPPMPDFEEWSRVEIERILNRPRTDLAALLAENAKAQAEKAERQRERLRLIEESDARRRARDEPHEPVMRGAASVPVAPTAHPVATPRERRPRRGAAKTASRGDPEPEPPPRRCVCGEIPPAGRAFCNDRHAARARKRRQRGREPCPSDELLELARLARQAIRAGADPLSVLAVVVWPPLTADEARRMLLGRAAAEAA